MTKNLIIFSDGGSRGNPGPAAIGYVIKDARGKILAQAGVAIGTATNNQAEYQAVVAALQKAAEFGGTDQIEIVLFVDSKLVAEQLSGTWQVKKPHLAALVSQIKQLEDNFSGVRYQHIPREKNSLADSLLNQALDGS